MVIHSDARLRSVLHKAPAMGVLRHTDAGYDEAIEHGKKFGLDM